MKSIKSSTIPPQVGIITKARQKLNFLSFKDKIMQDFYNSVENYNLDK
jgi:hypothetical protein